MITDEQKKISQAHAEVGTWNSTDNSSVRENIIQQNMQRIIADKKWYKSVSEKAKKNDVSIDQMLRMDAEYMLWQDSLKKATK
jgi:5-methylcytosine-specific restriction endonuclease McrBC regulatory subunit McrC